MLRSGVYGSMEMARVRRARFYNSGLGGRRGVMVAVATTVMLAAMMTMVAMRETMVAAASINADILDVNLLYPTVAALELILRSNPLATGLRRGVELLIHVVVVNNR
jgi:hypothetical protein